MLYSDSNIANKMIELDLEIEIMKSYEKLIFSYMDDLNYSKLEFTHNLLMLNYKLN
jgi:hypothetical protein